MFSPMASFASNSGCDGCASIDQAFGGQISNVNTAVNNFNQNHVLDHAASTVMSGPNPVGRPAPNLSSQPYVPMPNGTSNQQAMQQMVNQAVSSSQGAESASPPAYQQASRPPVRDQIASDAIVNSPYGQSMESFAVMEGPGVQVNIPGRLILFNLATVILVALAFNEASKYYINRALSSADGQPHYYLAYAIGAFILSAFGHWVSKRWLA